MHLKSLHKILLKKKMGYKILKRLDRQISLKDKHNNLRRIEVNLKEHATLCIFVYRKPFRVIQFLSVG